MTKEQRIAISRVISDMIKADNIIEETEIQDMKQLMSDYSLTRQDMEAAQNIKLSDAIPVLRVLPQKVREEFVNKIYGIAQSDNVCVPREALLLIALKYCLLDEGKSRRTANRCQNHTWCHVRQERQHLMTNTWSILKASLIKE